MTGQYIVQGIFALAGIVRNVGRGRARLFYGILGVIIIGMAVFFFVETRKAMGQPLF